MFDGKDLFPQLLAKADGDRGSTLGYIQTFWQHEYSYQYLFRPTQAQAEIPGVSPSESRHFPSPRLTSPPDRFCSGRLNFGFGV